MKNARVFLAAAMLVFRVHGHALLANTLYLRDNTRNGRKKRKKKNKADGKQRCDECYNKEKQLEQTMAQENAAMCRGKK